jgi:hypothetical protein
MELADIVAVTGMPGLFKVVTRRNDGLIVTSLIDDKTQFIAGRTHLFTTLDNITLYTTGEPALLKDVLASINKSQEKHAVPDAKDDAALKAWLEAVLPEYDKEKVHVSDMKKLAKWYALLDSKQLIAELIADKKEESKEEGETSEKKETKKEAKPAKEVKAKTAKADKGAKVSTGRGPAVKKITAPRKAS